MAKKTEPDGENRKPNFSGLVQGLIFGDGPGIGDNFGEIFGFGDGDGRFNPRPDPAR